MILFRFIYLNEKLESEWKTVHQLYDVVCFVSFLIQGWLNERGNRKIWVKLKLQYLWYGFIQKKKDKKR